MHTLQKRKLIHREVKQYVQAHNTATKQGRARTPTWGYTVQKSVPLPTTLPLLPFSTTHSCVYSLSLQSCCILVLSLLSIYHLKMRDTNMFKKPTSVILLLLKLLEDRHPPSQQVGHYIYKVVLSFTKRREFRVLPYFGTDGNVMI